MAISIEACRSIKAFDDGQKFHGYLIRSGLCSILSVRNSLLGMYTDIRMDWAESLFDEMDEKDVISWSVMIGGYVHGDEAVLGLEMFKRMVLESKIKADEQTMVSVLKGCSKLSDIRMGKSVHGFVVKRGLDYDTFLGNTLVDFYCKCGEVDSGARAFVEMPRKNVVTWNSMLSGYVHSENHLEGLALFARMGESGVDADEVTLANLLVICRDLRDLRRCKTIHSRVIRRGLRSNDVVMNSLLDAYAKCGRIDLSRRVFCGIDAPDIITWSTMISGFTHCAMPNEAIALYREMQLSHFDRNPVTLLNLLEACSVSAEIAPSRSAHGIATRMGLASDVVVGTALLDMYAKCGAIEMSRKVFSQISETNIYSWSAIIAAHGLNGRPRDALSMFLEMERSGTKGNSVTALAVLSACCHGGLVEEGIAFFKDWTKHHPGNNDDEELYACVVDMLARAGNLDDAMRLIGSHRDWGGASAWSAVLSACRNYEDRELGTGAASQVLEMEPWSSAGYLLASSVCANGGSWTDASRLRQMMTDRGVKVAAGYSVVRVDGRAYGFTAGAGDDGGVVCGVAEQLHAFMRMNSCSCC
ncbi:pentatricopeptide repeat-containing protein At2g17210 isoform X2 [Andrographis paniculata]|uniref:pentatricopeptide repeat-containing protein At2g17210 isoform X2 n=1 Tax=Andrographis paniculata TaxID=175694 RepID=UPI0021E8EDBD|nr:pentatricopeptide repeat-containing protein At2g17210 isoform X2 [Andrographis paniculata]